MALLTLVTNARYLLMSCSLSQKLPPDPAVAAVHRGLCRHRRDVRHGHRRAGGLEPLLLLRMMTVAIPGWALGTFLGTSVGNILPANVVSALSVGLYGMFLAVIIPAARKSKVILGGWWRCPWGSASCWPASPLFAQLAEGTRIILITVGISAGAALLFPVKEEKEASHGA